LNSAAVKSLRTTGRSKGTSVKVPKTSAPPLCDASGGSTQPNEPIVVEKNSMAVMPSSTGESEDEWSPDESYQPYVPVFCSRCGFKLYDGDVDVLDDGSIVCEDCLCDN
jgi:hypothetical protein